ncbi:TonB-dependent receptor [Sphingomonas sp. RB56-2]|uniref:TonB-dependent receptor n=1 Tax=Sphingomonas brevis TaxID=2908206 RepID=A0ABT0S7W6_9SPHN|nr:TonB-dependent receptor [Sphingomonas brevis]
MKKIVLLASSALVAPAVVVVAPMSAVAQQITTSIQGKVTNESGAAVANATVTVTDTRTGASRDISADSQGLFNAENLTTGGPYTVTAKADGYQGQTVDTIFTTLQGPTELTFSLSPVAEAADTQTIVVTAARVKATQLEIGPGTSFNTQALQAAPTFDRDIRDIIKADPRVSLDRQDVSSGGSGADRISCLGGNDRFNTFTVDGIPQSDIYGLNDTGFSSRSSTPVPYDAVREAQVQFAPFDVEYGQFTGCAINVVTKSGSNRFHGGGFYEFSNSDLRGDELPGIHLAPIQPDKRWGVNFSGPIIKDRLFFFGAYEKQTSGQSQDDGPAGAGYANEITAVTEAQFNQISQAILDIYGVDTGPLVHNRPFTNKRLFGRVDWQITDDHRLELTHQRLKENTVKTDDFNTTDRVVTGLNNYLNSGTDSKYSSVRLYSNWTDNFSTELRYAHSNVQDIQDPIGGGEAQSGSPITRIVVGVDNPGSAPDATIIAGPGFSRTANDLKTKLDQFKATANYDAGDHKLKLGFEYNHANLFNLFVQNATGTLVFRNFADLQNGILSNGTSTANPISTVTVPGTAAGAYINGTESGDINDAAASFSRTIYSLYAQDDWRVNDDLKLVGGIRVDWYSGDHPRLNEVFENRYGFGNDTGFSDLDPVILPRLGFTYNLPEFSVVKHSRLQGGVGIFSGGDPVVWFGNVFQNNGMGFGQGVSRGSVGGIPTGCPAGPLDVVDAGGNFTGFPQCVVDHASTLAATGNGFTQAVDPDLKLSTVWRANIGYQADVEFADTAFGRGWHVNLDYIYSQYKNPFTIADLSQAVDPRKGLNGYTIDGRPIYSTIDPLATGCSATLVEFNPTPIYDNVSNACFGGALPTNLSNRGEYLLTNAGSYRTHVASFVLQKNFDAGLLTSGGSSVFTFGYAYTNAHDRRNMYNSTAGSNFNVTSVFDRQDPDASRAFYETRHNITFSGNIREKFFDDLATSLGFTFVARSGRPYSLTFAGSGVFNANQSSSTNGNLVYLPTGLTDPNVSPLSTISASDMQLLVDFASSHKCAKKYIGSTIPRNTCTNDWYKDLDLRFSQELPGPGRLFGSPYGIKDKLTAYLMVDNFLNLLNKDWNNQHRRDFGGRQQIAGLTTTGVDANGKYIFANASPLVTNAATGLRPYDTANFINVSSSVWKLKLGISYEF